MLLSVYKDHWVGRFNFVNEFSFIIHEHLAEIYSAIILYT